MSTLTTAQQTVLDALWESRSPATVADVHAQLASVGHHRSTATIKRTLDRLVALSCAERTMIRYARGERPHAHYVATSRRGEQAPAHVAASKFLSWLWAVRFSWEQWSLLPARGMVWADSFGQEATTEEWAWLERRRVFWLGHESLTPEDPEWWQDMEPLRHLPAPRSPNP